MESREHRPVRGAWSRAWPGPVSASHFPFGFVFALVLVAVGVRAAERPNIVLILADDMGFSDIGCYGGEVRTPNLDRLAREGMRLLQFYNNAKCTTTRATLISGLWPRPRVRWLDAGMVTIAELLRGAGYQTALSGKWHLGSRAPHRPSDRGFDRYFGLLDGCCNYFDPARADPPFKGGRVRVVMRDDRRVESFPAGFYMTDAITDYALQTLGDFAREGKPFFLHVAYTAPHYPLHARPEDIARYRGKYLMGWEELRARRRARMIELGVIDPAWREPPVDPLVFPWAKARPKEWYDLRMAVYAAMIDRMDQGIGKILRRLDDLSLAESTLVLFLSDNGGCSEQYPGDRPENPPGPKEYYTTCGPCWAWAQNTPFRRYKTWMYEGGISTPCIARWPKVIRPGSVTREVGHIVDILPTCGELAGATYPRSRKTAGGEVAVRPPEGVSLVPVLRGGKRSAPVELYWEHIGNRAVREGDWKLVWDRTVRRWELYDMAADRTETRDLVEEKPELAERLRGKWMAWARKTGVTVERRKRKPARKPSAARK